MGRSATPFATDSGYSRSIVTGQIGNAYSLGGPAGAVRSFFLDFPGNAKVGDGSAGTIEFFVAVRSFNFAMVSTSAFTGSGNGQVGALWLQSATRLRWQADPPGPGIQDWGPDLVNPAAASTFYHVCLQTSGNGTWYFWLDGVYKGSESDTIGQDDMNFAFTQVHFGISGNQSNQVSIGPSFDEIRISSIQRYTPGSNFTPPTVAFVNDADTLALFHGETSTELDDTGFQLDGVSAISAAATVSATALMVEATEYVHTLYWNGSYTEEVANIFAAATFTVTATLAASGGISKDGASALTSTATLSASGGIDKNGASALTSTAILSASGGISQSAASALSATATLSASGGFRKDGASALSATATLSATGIATVAGAAALAVTATLSATGSATVSGAAALAATATLSATGSTSDLANAALSMSATVSAAASIIRNGVATLNSTATLSASAQDFDIASANLTSAFTLTATSQKIIVGSAVIQSAFVMTTVAEMLQAANVERTIAVKSETRIIKALQEQRIITVNSEGRINSVLADSRTILVPDETRILKEP